MFGKPSVNALPTPPANQPYSAAPMHRKKNCCRSVGKPLLPNIKIFGGMLYFPNMIQKFPKSSSGLACR